MALGCRLRRRAARRCPEPHDMAMGLSPLGLHPSPTLQGDCAAAPRRLASPYESLYGLDTASPYEGRERALWLATRRAAGRSVVLEASFSVRSAFPLVLPFGAAHRCSVARRRRH